MDVFSAYNLGTAGWLALQAVPLVISPSIVATILSPELHQLTSLEQYFARSLGFTLLLLAILCLLLTGIIPLSSSTADDSASSATPSDAYSTPTVLSTMLYHSLLAFYNYTRFTRFRQPAFVLAAICSGCLATVGLWALLFGNSSGRISRRTGADKRTSGWPFKNLEADKRRGAKKTS